MNEQDIHKKLLAELKELEIISGYLALNPKNITLAGHIISAVSILTVIIDKAQKQD